MNRGGFLTDAIQVVKPVMRNEIPKKSTKPHENEKSREEESSTKILSQPNAPKESVDIERHIRKAQKLKTVVHKSKRGDKHDSSKSNASDNRRNSHSSESRVPLKSSKHNTTLEIGFSKPILKVVPLPPLKPKKKVLFSTEPPKVHVFEIQEGNKMRSTKNARKSLDRMVIRQMPLFSLEKVTLMKILRWNPHWLEEQVNNCEPPPILGHNNPPLTIFHSFNNHKQYIQ